MGFFDDLQESHKKVNVEGEHEGSFTHELIAGAASFEAVKAFEDKQRREGKAVSHGFAKELIAGFAGAEVDKLVETKGLDYIDAEEAKHKAKKQAEQLYDEQYSDLDQYDPEARPPPQWNY